MLKSLQALAVVALVATSATGAFASNARGGLDDGFHGDTAYETTLPNFPDAKYARGAYASTKKARKSIAVYAPDGVYQGSDPDTNVRLELRRDECNWGC